MERETHREDSKVLWTNGRDGGEHLSSGVGNGSGNLFYDDDDDGLSDDFNFNLSLRSSGSGYNSGFWKVVVSVDGLCWVKSLWQEQLPPVFYLSGGVSLRFANR
ncbi:hypothetical protein Q8A73_002894 [Channa argus]|nr:hypothetical protein Q8A73_002894 [Channa argus]